VTADTAPLAGVHLPEFGMCRPEPDWHSTALDPREGGTTSTPAHQC
jgi:hypothetical protein